MRKYTFIALLLIISAIFFSCSTESEKNPVQTDVEEDVDKDTILGDVTKPDEEIDSVDVVVIDVEFKRDSTTKIVDVYNPKTGRTWMDRNLGASQVATSYADTAAYGDYYQWGREADGHQIKDSKTTSVKCEGDNPGHGDFITTSFYWQTKVNYDLWQGVDGKNNPCPSGYLIPTKEDWEKEIASWIFDDASGALASHLKLPLSGYRAKNDGDLMSLGSYAEYWSSTVDRNRVQYLSFNYTEATIRERDEALPVRCIKEQDPSEIIEIDEEPIPSDTIDLDENTEMGYVYNPKTGKAWMDRNLGASRVARSAADSLAFGDLYQWGRASDGHEKIYSNTTSIVSDSDNPGHGDMIVDSFDWLNSQNDDLWQGIDGTNNPCPSGYRIPTEAEWRNEIATWTSETGKGAFNSDLKLPWAGLRNSQENGGFDFVDYYGYYWSSTTSSTRSRNVVFGRGYLSWNDSYRADGRSVRCIMDTLIIELEEGEVYNPATGEIWMDRNLGASRVATNFRDSLAYGDLYQWGRRSDGHEKRNSDTTSTVSDDDNVGHGKFIVSETSPYDWRIPQNRTLWDGVGASNNPCPSGYRIPTDTEWRAERATWDGSFAFGPPLNLPLAGYRHSDDGSLGSVGYGGYYWSSGINESSSFCIYFGSGGYMSIGYRTKGQSIRCIKD